MGKKQNTMGSKNANNLEEDVQVAVFTRGLVLWKRFLMRLKYNYLKPLKKHERPKYKS
jgi:hypothetical protein